MTQQLLQIKSLDRSPLNVRKTEPKAALEELKASILAHGLMQNLVVVPAKKNGRYEVIAGGRRLAALMELRDEGKLPDEFDVPCQVVTPEHAEEMSLAENTIRHAMHPADEFEAYTALIEAGATIESVAQRFGKTGRHVEQRLKLGRVAPELVQAYRDEEIALEVLEAFTVTDDRERQIKVYESAKGGWQIERPRSIREMLTEEAVSGTDRRVKFVGLDTYKEAGGAVRCDLFEDNLYLENPELLNALVSEKLKLIKAELEAEGWLWVTVAEEYDYTVTSGCRRLQPQPLDAPQELLDLRDAIEAEQEAIEQEWQAADEDDEDLIDSIRSRSDDAEQRLDAVQAQLDAFLRYDPEEVKTAGCYAYINHDGTLQIDRGRVKREDAIAVSKAGTGGATTSPAEKPKGLPESLKADLESYRLSAAQAEIAKNPALAFDLLVFKATKEMCGCGYTRDGAQVNFTRNCGGTKTSNEARRYVSERLDAIKEALPLEWLEPDSEAEQFTAFQALAAEQKHQLLAFCVASSLQPKLLEGEPQTAYDIALAQTGANVADHWRPSATNYLSRVKTSELLDIGDDIFGANFWSTNRRNSKKTALVSELDRAFLDPENQICTEKLKNWLPKGMAFGNPQAEATKEKPVKSKKVSRIVA